MAKNAKLQVARSELSFTAIDFETANRYSNSACAVGLVKVHKGQIVSQQEFLIRPPFQYFEFTHIHGITWPMVAQSPSFAELWPALGSFFEGIDFLAAHNASFDRRVLWACCQHFHLAVPELSFRCTVALARATWGLRPTTLRHVADYLGLELCHHQAGSDAHACAQIVLRACEPMAVAG